MRILRPFVLGVVSLVVISWLASCTSVSRRERDEVIDVSGNWNDTDSRQVSETMIKDLLGQIWVDKFEGFQGRPPVIIVGSVRNNTAEHINSATFINDLERALINSNKFKVVAGAGDRPELRDEVKQMQENARPETMKKLKQETGADFYMLGQINDIVDKEGGKSVRYYQVILELVQLETHEKKWMGKQDIKKYVKKSKFGF